MCILHFPLFYKKFCRIIVCNTNFFRFTIRDSRFHIQEYSRIKQNTLEINRNMCVNIQLYFNHYTTKVYWNETKLHIAVFCMILSTKTGITRCNFFRFFIRFLLREVQWLRCDFDDCYDSFIFYMSLQTPRISSYQKRPYPR